MNFTLHDADGIALINSLELYNELELNKKYYYRWIQGIVKNPCLTAGKHYFSYDAIPTHRGRVENQYLLSITLAKFMCMTTATVVAKKIMGHLEKREKVRKRRTLHF